MNPEIAPKFTTETGFTREFATAIFDHLEHRNLFDESLAFHGAILQAYKIGRGPPFDDKRLVKLCDLRQPA
ncbi:MAG: hypothetical protein PHC51_11990 [bacterium]|nr:hypothetical protein [bacterium]